MSTTTRLFCFLTLIFFLLPAGTADAALTTDQQKCQKRVAREGKKFVSKSLQQLNKCHDKIATGSLPALTDCRAEPGTAAKITTAEGKLASGIAKDCADPVISSLVFGGACFGVETLAELQACSLAVHESEVDRIVDSAYATDDARTSSERKCQKKAGSKTRSFAQTRLVKLQRCKDRVARGSLPVGTDCSADAKTALAISKNRDRAASTIAKVCTAGLLGTLPFGAPCDFPADGAALAECLLSVAEISGDAWIVAEYGMGPGGGTSLAKEITSAVDCVDGPLSRCRVGDYLLENDEIRIVIQDIQRGINSVGLYGGQIIDADLNRGGGPEIDNFEEWATNINIEGTAHYTALSIINDGSDGQAAIIRATGVDDLLDTLNPSSTIASFGFPLPASADDVDLPVEITTDYTLEPGRNYVRVDTRIQNIDGGSSYDIFFGEFMNGSGQVETFQSGYGFGEPLVTNRCPAAAPNPCNVVIYRGVDEAADVSYGYVHEIPGSTAFTTSGVSVPLLGVEITLALIGAAPPNFTLEAMGTPGDQLSFTRYFIVGDGSVSSVLSARNEIQSLATGVVEGTVETTTGGPAAGVEVAVLGLPADGPSTLGAPLTRNVVNHTVTDAFGDYSIDMPPGDYDVVFNLEGHSFQGGGATPVLNPVTIPAFGSTNLDVTLPDAGSLMVTVTDGALAALPAKASVVGFDPSQDPLNSQSILGLISNTTGVFSDQFSDGNPFGVTEVLFIDPTGVSDTIPIEPGSYEVVVDRGPEYSIDSVPVVVSANLTTAASAKIAPVIDSSGFVSGDFHVHSVDSPDSEVLPLERIVSMMSAGLEFFTPSDHEFRSDFQPLIISNGWDAIVTSTTNNEITTFDYGHFNAWPLTIDPGFVNGGAVDHGGAAPDGLDFPSAGNYSLTPGEIFTTADSDPGTNVVQVNHIHSHFGLDGGSGLAIDTGVEPPKSAVPASARRLDPALEDVSKGYFDDGFDVLEIWIGESRAQIFTNFLGQNAGDWFNLLNQGILRVGIADSDTHRRKLTQAGNPRTMIASGTDVVAALDAETLATSLKSGRAFGTNGPMLRVTLEALTSGLTASLEDGDSVLVAADDGKVEITVDVQSPSWAEFDSIEFYMNSATTKSTSMEESGAGPVTVARYAIAPDFVLTEGTDFTASTVAIDGTVPAGDRIEATATLTLDGTLNPALTEDTWIVVMVKGTDGISKPLFPMVPNSLDTGSNSTLGDLTDGNLGEDGITALAFTNPLYVDFDDGSGGSPDGDFDPPGVQITP